MHMNSYHMSEHLNGPYDCAMEPSTPTLLISESSVVIPFNPWTAPGIRAMFHIIFAFMTGIHKSEQLPIDLKGQHMSSVKPRRLLTLAAVAAAAVTTAIGVSPASAHSAKAAAPAWSGGFTGYGSSAWTQSWGVASQGQWGGSDLQAVNDPTTPGGGQALRVYYGAGSSAHSCSNCPNPGGGQFYQQLSALGSTGATLSSGTTLDLKYNLKFPAGWDFGKAGKLPGLYGGQIGQESGGNHGNGWSTRYMWRNHGAPNAGEIYLYTPTNSGPTGYGVDYFGSWNWTADGNWHTAEQLVNRQTGDVTVWFDGKQVLAAKHIATGITGIKFSGVFFSTFFGGHDTSWGPKVSEYAYFANFSLSQTVQH